MRRVSFRVPAAETEDLLDALLPMLPTGVQEEEAGEGWTELASTAAVLPGREALQAAAGCTLEDYAEEEVPADWRARRARFGRGGVLVAERVLVRQPWDPPAPAGVIDVVVERRGSTFGSGSHPTTQMCIGLLLALTPEGGAADLGCGVGTLAIVAAKLGWAPVVAVDRMAVAVDVARENVERNGVAVECAVADLARDAVPLASLLLVNAPPPVHARVVAAVTSEVRHVIVSGIVGEEVASVLADYARAGFAPGEALGTHDEWMAIRLERRDG
jgi:ribosomal protein L11 methyltransferase